MSQNTAKIKTAYLMLSQSVSFLHNANFACFDLTPAYQPKYLHINLNKRQAVDYKAKTD